MRFFYKYIFRGIGLVLFGAMLTVLWTACSYQTNREREKKARDESKRVFDAMHKDADAEIRKYTDSQTQAGKAAAKEKKQ